VGLGGVLAVLNGSADQGLPARTYPPLPRHRVLPAGKAVLSGRNLWHGFSRVLR
jgi:hypothetical protein